MYAMFVRVDGKWRFEGFEEKDVKVAKFMKDVADEVLLDQGTEMSMVFTLPTAYVKEPV